MILHWFKILLIIHRNSFYINNAGAALFTVATQWGGSVMGWQRIAVGLGSRGRARSQDHAWFSSTHRGGWFLNLFRWTYLKRRIYVRQIRIFLLCTHWCAVGVIKSHVFFYKMWSHFVFFLENPMHFVTKSFMEIHHKNTTRQYRIMISNIWNIYVYPIMGN